MGVICLVSLCECCFQCLTLLSFRSVCFVCLCACCFQCLTSLWFRSVCFVSYVWFFMAGCFRAWMNKLLFCVLHYNTLQVINMNFKWSKRWTSDQELSFFVRKLYKPLHFISKRRVIHCGKQQELANYYKKFQF